MKQLDNFSYDVQDIIGKGSFGEVYSGQNDLTGEQVAIKVISKFQSKKDKSNVDALEREISVMKQFDNENIVKLIDVLETANNVYIVQEFCEGGDYQHFLKKNKILSEEFTVDMLKQLLSGFIELIKFDTIHRDLKPANILIRGQTFKLADFGFSRIVDNHRNTLVQSQVGTPLYMSPQVIAREKYTAKTDIWSLGFIVYESLFGKTPWVGSTEYQLLTNIKSIPLEFPEKVKISMQMQDLLERMLVIDESKRITWQQLYNHPIFKDTFQYYHLMTMKADTRIKQFVHELRSAINAKSINLKDCFVEVIKDFQKPIGFDDFSLFIETLDGTLSKQERKQIFDLIDEGRQNLITYEQFYSWTMNCENYQVKQMSQEFQQQQTDQVAMSREIKLKNVNKNWEKDSFRVIKIFKGSLRYFSNDEIKDVFRRFNKSKTGYMNLAEMSYLMQGLQTKVPFTEQMALQIFDHFDLNDDGKITWENFWDVSQELKILHKGKYL